MEHPQKQRVSAQDIWAEASDQSKNYYRLSLTHRLGRTRLKEFDALLDQLAEEHDIKDRFLLERAVDTAMLIYQGRNGVMDKKDRRDLLRHLPKVIDVLGCNENDRRLADMLMDRHRNLVSGGPWDMNEATEITLQFSLMKPRLEEMERLLRRPPQKADLNLHAAIAWLERCWQALTGKKTSKTFTMKDRAKNRQLAQSRMARFLEAAVRFIDPDAVKKLASATKHRLKPLPVSPWSRDCRFSNFEFSR